MNAIDLIAELLDRSGYRSEAVVRNYRFSDVLDPAGISRTVPLVAFSSTPPSYRSAAMAVVRAEGGPDVDLVRRHRSLGAPLLFVVEGDEVTLWQVRSVDVPRPLETIRFPELSALFERNKVDWHPDAIHRAKAIGSTDAAHQLDFVDTGLLPAIEGEVHAKLDRLLIDTLEIVRASPMGGRLDVRTVFRVVFRMLAAKVLQDRGHACVREWDPADLTTVLRAIEGYYSLGSIDAASPALRAVFGPAWAHLRAGIDFSNISADDLAFVYENTLVTPQARKIFGTHGTPRQLAEFVVQRLELHRHDPADLRIYEPFAGSGVLLVSALRHLRDLLPGSWSDQRRHDFLIERISGDEIDPFACEVAVLSLILADYPNHNGWHVGEVDLFAGDNLARRLRAGNIVLCNPPFEAFREDEVASYPAARGMRSKAVAALDAAITARPAALGFVLPRAFILERQFAEQRRRIEAAYGSVEILKLPDGVFGASDVESAAIVARGLRDPSDRRIEIRSTEVSERDRLAFLGSGIVSDRRFAVRTVGEVPAGDLWIPPLQDLWQQLSGYPRLSSILKASRGLEWTYEQDEAISDGERPGFRKGYGTARRMQQYRNPRAAWLDFRTGNLRRGATHPWEEPKLVANAVRLSRGPWCLAAAVDTDGLVCSQQFFGLWPRSPMSKADLSALCAVLNGPVANAFVAVNSPKRGLRGSVIGEIPIPPLIPHRLGDLAAEYLAVLNGSAIFPDEDRLARLLIEIDATVLEAYDLPYRMEKQLLAFFEDGSRPTGFHWRHWNEMYPATGLTLAERMSGRFHAPPGWIEEVFRPLPATEAASLREGI